MATKPSGRRRTAIAVAAAAALSTSMATADPPDPPTGASCADDAERAQHLRDDAKLLAARERFLRCAHSRCPPIVRTECEQWLTKLVPRIPTVIPSARDAAGNDLVDVSVEIDDLPVASAAGVAVFVDPGPHTVRFRRRSDGRPETSTTVTFIAREAETGRIVTAVLPDESRRPEAAQAPTSTPPRPAPHVPTAAWVTGGVAVASLGLAAVFGILGWSEYGHLDGSCSPNCAHDDVDAVRRDFRVAQIAGAVGIVAAGATLVIFLLRPEPPRATIQGR